MTDKEKETTTAGSQEIPQRRSEGIAGSSRDASKRDHLLSGAGCDGRENEELRRQKRHELLDPAIGSRAGKGPDSAALDADRTMQRFLRNFAFTTHISHRPLNARTRPGSILPYRKRKGFA